MLSPELLLKIVSSFPGGSSAHISWSSLASFFEQRGIQVQKNQLARLIVYVQSFIGSRETPSRGPHNYHFFNFLITPKYLYLPNEPLPVDSLPLTLGSYDFNDAEIELVTEIVKVLIHKIGQFVLLFRKLSPETVESLFLCLSQNTPAIKRDLLVQIITRNDIKIRECDLDHVFDEFRAAPQEITWASFRDFFAGGVWKS